ncbi:MAG: 2-oxoacid:acceptor oxidoreductase family protein [Candidatus Omnitrophica bacterium]|nr:2-oxoacid:acceptor oxidoreductase family protein [Candidatus Omnitrophota bacterium]MCF7892786.1 2-oxoacid:acceptor oxidoreductase family protein [Candidatus Omnitrophota bacterium]
MKEIKIFARAGQGAITTAAILGEALFYEDKFSYAFPHFGAARMGAPMNAFLRFDQNPIRLRSQIYNPDYIIVIDPTLIEAEQCFDNLKDNSKAVVAVRENTNINNKQNTAISSLPAEKIAMDIIGRPFANTVLLGAFSKATGEVKLDSILKSVEVRFKSKPAILDKNIEAVKKGYESV